MIGSFFKVLSKSFKVLKKEPIILIPYLMFNLTLATLTQVDIISKNNLLLNHLIEWLIPSLLISPFIIITALDIFQDKAVKISEVLSRCMQCMWPFFIFSLHKPLIFYAFFSILKINASGVVSEAINVSGERLIIGVALIIAAMIFAVLTIYFQSFYVIKLSETNLTFGHFFTKSIDVFFRFKWVTIMFGLYFLVTMFFGLFSVVSLFLPVIPNHYQLIGFGLINAIISTLLKVFILRLFLYIRTTINLDYS
tara:strand:+ start:1478 stop:2233 length:756 start_codon:yes stop_codon:yes gene_type:complete